MLDIVCLPKVSDSKVLFSFAAVCTNGAFMKKKVVSINSSVPSYSSPSSSGDSSEWRKSLCDERDMGRLTKCGTRDRGGVGSP